MKAQTPTVSMRSSGLTGVHGFLLFFVLTIVVGGPAVNLFMFAITYRETMSAIAQGPHLYLLCGLYFSEQLLVLAITMYGIFCGVQLWRIRTNAVAHAKQFLLLLMPCVLVEYLTAVIWQVLVRPDITWSTAMSATLLGERPKSALETALYVALWYSYLTKSKRVRLTYLRSSVDDERLRSGNWLKLSG